MDSIVNPTPFDLGVINVVEYLDSMLPQLSQEYAHLQNKKDILASIGINPASWSNMVNHQRHVTTKVAKQAEIVSKLRQLYKVDPQYIWNYGHYKRMFITNLVDTATVQATSSAIEMRKTIVLLQERIDSLEQEIKRLNAEVKRYKSIAELQDRALQHSVAADTGGGQSGSKSGKPKPYPTKKGR